MSLQIYLGPMYAGKTTKMIQMIQSNTSKQKVAIDNDIIGKDNRVSIGKLQNHNKVYFEPVYRTKFLTHVMNESCFEESDKGFKAYLNMMRASYIYINECQFFPDLKEQVVSWINQGKHVFLYGLDADYKMEPFGQTSILIPYCSHLEKLKGTCKLCSNPSIVSYRTSSDTQVYLPNADAYIPLCLKCKKDLSSSM